MSEGDVEVVRRFWDAAENAFEVYWQDPRSIADDLKGDTLRPEQRAMFELVHPDMVWAPAFLGDERRGAAELAETWDDYLTWADDYRARLQEVSDLGDGRVLATVRLTYRAKAGGGVVEGRLYSILHLEDGLIVRIDEYTERADAMEAAGG
jgi:ketosteroid isomerase-like protein